MTFRAPPCSYTETCRHNIWTRSNNLVRYVSKVAPSPEVYISSARWHSTRAVLLRIPTSHHGVVYRCGAHSVLCGYTDPNRPLPFTENSGPIITKKSPQRMAFSLKMAVYLTGSQARVDLVLQMRRLKKCGSPQKLTKRVCLYLNVPKTTVWKILKKTIAFRPSQITTGASFEWWWWLGLDVVER